MPKSRDLLAILSDASQILAFLITLSSIVLSYSFVLNIKLSIYIYNLFVCIILLSISLLLIIKIVLPYMNNRSLRSYLDLVFSNMRRVQVPGILGLTVGDILTKELFVELPWRFLEHKEPRNDSLVSTIVEGIFTKNKSYLVLSDPGQGKSILLKKVFEVTKEEFKRKGKILPIFIEVRRISAFFEKNSTSRPFKFMLWEYLVKEESPRFPLSYKEFEKRIRNGRIVFILDGLDEASPLFLALLNKNIKSLAPSPLLISCRTNEYQLYIKNSEMDQIADKIEILPLNDKKIEIFINNYVKYLADNFNRIQINKYINRPTEVVNDFINILKHDQKIHELAKYPLLLSMTLYLFLTEPQGPRYWNIHQLYSHYVTNILTYETNRKQKYAKLNIIIKQDILTELAGFLFKHNRTYFRMEELREIVVNKIKSDISINEIQDNICNHSLIQNQAEYEYSFIHTSFQDYYTARYIIQILEYERINEGIEVLKKHIPSDIERFLKYMLKSLNKEAAEKVALSLRNIYSIIDSENLTTNLKAKDKINKKIMGKQQAAHYLSILIPYLPEELKEKIEYFLIEKLRTERNKFITRGIRVGLFRHANRRDILGEYLEALEKDEEERRVNCGYYLMYYGDQLNSYIDLGGKNCENTVRNIIRHLLSLSHRSGWPLDLITFRQCILQNDERRKLIISKNYLLKFLYAIQKNLPDYINDKLTYDQLAKLIDFLSSLKDELDYNTFSKIENLQREIKNLSESMNNTKYYT